MTIIESGLYRVKFRQGGKWNLRQEANNLDGEIFYFTSLWPIEKDDSSIYAGEIAMGIDERGWQLAHVPWIASGDLESIGASDLSIMAPKGG